MKTFTYKNLTVTAERRKLLNVNGNPLYIVKPVNFDIVRADGIYRNYLSSGYYLLESFNIDWDVMDLLKDLDKKIGDGWKVDFPANSWDTNYHLINQRTGQHLLIDVDDIDRMEELTNIDLLLQLAWKEVK